MKGSIAGLVLLAGTGLGLAGCATPAQQAQHRGNLLAAAGFTQLPANTHARQAEMARLPPNRIVRTSHHGKLVYLYADPLVCDCLYIGDQRDWGHYQRELLRLRIANERMEAAQMNQAAATNWSWGPWGPGWW